MSKKSQAIDEATIAKLLEDVQTLENFLEQLRDALETDEASTYELEDALDYLQELDANTEGMINKIEHLIK